MISALIEHSYSQQKELRFISWPKNVQVYSELTTNQTMVARIKARIALLEKAGTESQSAGEFRAKKR